MNEGPDGYSLLRDSEKDVFMKILSGMTRQEIADARVVSPETVKLQTHAILKKLGVHSQAQAILAYYQWATRPITDEEAETVDFFMSEHMYDHSVANNINRMSCDAECRTRALQKAVNNVLEKRRDM